MSILPDDPRVANLPRHLRLDDLLGASDDPMPRNTFRCEWIGERNIMEDPRVQANLLLGRYSEVQKRALMNAAARANTRGTGHRIRLLEHNHQLAQAVVPHLGRTYVFSELNGYLQHVDNRDYDAIFASPIGHEFVNLDDPQMVEERMKVSPLANEVFVLIAQETYRRDDDRITARSQGQHGTIVART